LIFVCFTLSASMYFCAHTI